MDKTITYLQIADFIIKFEFYPSSFKGVEKTLKKNILNTYGGFIINNNFGKKIDFTFTIKDKLEMDLLINRKKKTTYKYLNLYERKELHITTYYYINLIQLRHILREVLQILLTKNQGFQLHASASIVNNKAVIFVGKHTAGKSTAVKLAKRKFPIFSDDSIALRVINGKLYAYNTFEFEKNHLHKINKKYLVDSINFLYKSKNTISHCIKDKDIAIKLLLKECWFMDKSLFKSQSKTILKLINSDISFNKLYFSLNSNKFTKILTETKN